MKTPISKTVWLLSLISFFTDIASEMLYPIMPLYLQSIGFGVLWMGLLEGLAEATAGLSKSYFGKQSDLMGKRVPFIQWGYGLSALAKPMLYFFTHPLGVFLARCTDRLGKGIRTGARDALLSSESTPETRARVFAFHRSLDTLGAVLGPLLALLYLHYYPTDYATLFLLAFVPGILTVVGSKLIREKTSPPKDTAKPAVNFWVFRQYWRQSSVEYRKLVAGLLAFALFNSSDMFLLLKAQQSGFTATQLILLYMFFNLIYAIFSYPMGMLADRLGVKRVYLLGLALFALSYGTLAITQDSKVIIAVFFVYGMFAAATEGISKAWIAMLCKKEDTATALGTYAGFQSVFALLASSITGIVWFYAGAAYALLLTAFATVCVWVYLQIFARNNPAQ